MRVLWVATKPPWPLIDGGRVLMWHTINALARSGVDLTLVAPGDRSGDAQAVAKLQAFCRPILVPTRYRNRISSFSCALARGEPFTIVRHRNAGVRDQVAKLLAKESFDVVHAEQVHAIANCEPAFEKKVPVVFRAQNVESDLWEALAANRIVLRPMLRREARRLRAWEAAAVQRCEATVALSMRDAEKLRALTSRPQTIHHVRAPFPSALPSLAGRVLSGEPAIVLFGSSGWAPNIDAARWFIEDIWPAISNRVPHAVLHSFASVRLRGSLPPRMIPHAAPRESSEAFPPGSILVVPLRVGSGVRIKILEAWARGIPVIATPEAAQGLEATDGSELMIARDALEFANAVEAIHSQAGLRESITLSARKKLLAENNPTSIAENLVAIYRSVVTNPKER